MNLHSAVVKEKRVLTVDEVADFLQVHSNTIRKQIRNGNLRVFRIGKNIRIRFEDLENFMSVASLN